MIDELLDLAERDNQPAIGIGDSSNLFGTLEFSQKAIKRGIQPIIGCELAVDFGDNDEISTQPQFSKNSIVLIAQNEAGFLNLSHLVSRAYLEGVGERVAISIDWLNQELANNLICLSGGSEGAIDGLFAFGQRKIAQKRLERLNNIFDDRFYIEIQRHNTKNQKITEPLLLEYAYNNNIPIVASNEPFFPSKSDFEAHDALLAISSGTTIGQANRRRLTSEHYYKSQAQMKELFADLPEAIENTMEIAQRVSFFAQTRNPILPKFVKNKISDEEKALKAEAVELAKQAREGLKKRLKTIELASNFSEKDYHDRLEFELKVIENMKYPGYFLIVADFIKWAKSKNIPVGPGRGSGAGSLVAYALTITDLDPLRYNLLFERFLNPDRISMPDFDIDFCQDRREEVIKYVQEKYGHEQVAQIITFGSLQARAALRDVGRVLQMPYPQVDRICKLVPSNPANPISLPEAIKSEPKLQIMQQEDETVAQLLKIAQNLEGLYRHASTHAAGIVIGDRPIEKLVPLYRDPRSDMPVTQYSQKWVEAAGLVKFDFLGLKTLTIIDKTVKMIREKGEKDFSIENIPIDDEETYKLYQRAETIGVFQVESAGMRRALLELKPDRFEDIIALVALYRPGPMDNIGSFCNRKHGREDTTLLHPDMEPILSETYGIIVYQEQVMQIAQTLSGYSLGEADLLRRAMGKKDKKEMDRQRARFIKGAIDKGISTNKATQIFELLAKFANYGFNKSHAAAYALVSYQTAYLKAHYPHEFLASSMTLDMGNTDKLHDFKREADRLKIKISPPSINNSKVEFYVKNNAIQYSLSAIKGVGKQLVEHLEKIRGNNPFNDLSDFAQRIDSRLFNKRSLETMINAGAFDEIAPQREVAFGAIDMILAYAQRSSADKEQGIIDMFSADKPLPIHLPQNVKKWSEEEKLSREFLAIGFHLSAHPLDSYEKFLTGKRVQKFSEFEKNITNGQSAARLAGVVVTRQEKKTKKGKNMLICALSDASATYECLVFSENIEKFGDLLKVGNLVIIDVEAAQREENNSLRLLAAQEISKIIAQTNNNQEIKLTIFIENKSCLKPIKEQLKSGDNGEVNFIIIRDNGAKEYKLALKNKYQLNKELLSAIKSFDGVIDAQLS